MARHSTSLYGTPAAAKTKTGPLRKDMQVGDIFTVKGKSTVYMHTGTRTAPPSAGNRTGERLANGKVVVGYQSIILQGKVSTGEDGSSFTTNGNSSVVLLGRAKIEKVAA